MNTKQKKKEKNILLKLFLSLIYLIMITILFVISYNLYEEKQEIVSWSEVENIDDYTYMDIYKMSEKFAYYKESNIGIHFVIEKEETGLWHTYLIAINENEYDKYKSIIDYTYERTDKVPEPIRVYGYPVIISKEIKALAIKNIPNFVPKENEIVINDENYEKYLTNSYLDTTKEKKEEFSIILCISLLLIFIIFALMIMTIFDKGKIIEEIEIKENKIIKRKRKATSK